MISMKFEEYSLNPSIVRALNDMGICHPTEIQEKAIPKLLNSGKVHILAQAKTGTGKTLAFSIPVVNQISPKEKSVQAVVLVPTRELCKQVYTVIQDLTKYRKLKAVAVYGGVSINNQRKKIKSGTQIVIATPGRLMDLYRRKYISFHNVRFVVLDEADRMLDMGFLPDMQYILFKAMHNVKPRLLLFSATMLKQIAHIARQFSHGEQLFEINVSKDDITVANCQQFYYAVKDNRTKYSTFVSILHKEQPESSIVFVNTKRWIKKLKQRLRKERSLPIRFDTLHGDKTQAQREKVLAKFRNKNIDCLIATNVAARGLDIPHVTHVFNYDLPREGPEIYVHRIGRTSRMESDGNAISIVTGAQMKTLHKIKKFTNKPIKRLSLKTNEKLSKSKNPKRYGSNKKIHQSHAGD